MFSGDYYSRTRCYADIPNLFPECDIVARSYDGIGRGVVTSFCRTHKRSVIPGVKRCGRYVPLKHIPCSAVNQGTVCMTHNDYEDEIDHKTGLCSHYEPLPSPLVMLADCAED